uniref:Uncharacterized protein n=1 Tax=Glossina austeni TaxID=7395 RepID=A0A1A9V8X2_GLOAU
MYYEGIPQGILRKHSTAHIIYNDTIVTGIVGLSNCKYLLLLLLNVLVVEHEFVEDERNDSKNIKTGYNRLFNQFDCNTGPSNQTVYLTLDMEAYDNCPNFRKHFGTESQSPANNRSNNIEHKHELTGRGMLVFQHVPSRN